MAFANYDEDCQYWATKFNVQASDRASFHPWCKQFEDRCYKIEDKAANACGADGAMEHQATDAFNAGNVAIGNGSGSYTVAGGQGKQTCTAVSRIRDQQLATCRRSLSDCMNTKETFTAKSGSSPELKCYLFGPESPKWSTAAGKRRSLCQAIEYDLDMLSATALTERRQCDQVTSIVKSASDDKGSNSADQNKTYTGGRKCGVRYANADGSCPDVTNATGSDGTGQPPSKNSRDDANFQPVSFDENDCPGGFKKTNDGGACGLCGCRLLSDGRYCMMLIGPSGHCE